GKLVCPHHIQDFSSSERSEWIDAQYRQPLIRDRVVDRLLVFTEVIPVMPLEPGRISGHSHAGVATGRCASELLIPTAYHSLEIKLATVKIPVAGQGDFDAVIGQVSIEVRNSLFQRTLGFFLPHGRGNDPQAELFA